MSERQAPLGWVVVYSGKHAHLPKIATCGPVTEAHAREIATALNRGEPGAYTAESLHIEPVGIGGAPDEALREIIRMTSPDHPNDGYARIHDIARRALARDAAEKNDG